MNFFPGDLLVSLAPKVQYTKQESGKLELLTCNDDIPTGALFLCLSGIRIMRIAHVSHSFNEPREVVTILHDNKVLLSTNLTSRSYVMSQSDFQFTPGMLLTASARKVSTYKLHNNEAHISTSWYDDADIYEGDMMLCLSNVFTFPDPYYTNDEINVLYVLFNDRVLLVNTISLEAFDNA